MDKKAFKISTVAATIFLAACTTPKVVSDQHNVDELRAPAAFGDAKNACFYSAPCPDGRTAEWAQQRVSGDLMLSYLKTLKLRNIVKIAVVDTGYDMSGNKNSMVSPNPDTRKADAELGDVNRDEVGHGTAVSGLVGAKAPLGLAANLAVTSYRVAKLESTGSTEGKYLVNAIEKACNEGHEIINLSWGNSVDENNIVSAEKSYSKLLKKLEIKGCLLVVGAGNSSIRVERKDVDPDDNYLRVEAIAPSGERAYFTSNGELTAPGQGVFTLRSTNTTKSPRAESLCGTRLGHFVNGTSFSSPIAAALAGQVLNVYKSAPRFNKLAPIERIRMVTRTLTASQKVLGHVDGLLAVKMAYAWTRSKAGFLSIDDLFAFLKSERQNLCAISRKACQNQWQCDAKIACVTEARQRLSLCGPNDNSELVKDLLATGYEMGAFELTLQVMHTAAEQSAQNRDYDYARKKVARSTWAYQYKIWSTKGKGYAGAFDPESASNNMSFDVASSLLPHLVMRGYVGETSDANKAIPLFLNSRQFVARLSSSEKVGSKEDLELVRNIFDKAQKSLGANEALKILRESASRALTKAGTESSDRFDIALTWFRLTERLSSDAVFTDWVRALETIQNDFTKLFVKLRIDDSVPSNDVLELVKPFLEKRSALFGNLRENVVNAKASPDELQTFYAIALLSDQNLAATKRASALLAALETLSPEFENPKRDSKIGIVISHLSSQFLKLIHSPINKAEDPALYVALRDHWWSLGRTRFPSLALRLILFVPVSPYFMTSIFDDRNFLGRDVLESLKEISKLENDQFENARPSVVQLLLKYNELVEKVDGGGEFISLVFIKFANYIMLSKKDDFYNRYRNGVMGEALQHLVANSNLANFLPLQSDVVTVVRELRERILAEKIVGFKESSYARTRLLEQLAKVAP